MRNVLRQCTTVVVLGLAVTCSAQAADWVSVIQLGNNVREIDKSSIAGTPPVITYATRHVFADVNEYLVGRRGVKYLVMTDRADCSKRTTSKLEVDAYDEKMALISKQMIQNPDAVVVTPESIEEAVLNYVCKSK